jgi:hypothetical protein
MCIGGSLESQHTRHTGKGGGRLCDRCGIRAQHGHRDFAANGLRASQAARGGFRQPTPVMLGNHENAVHRISPFAVNAASSSGTSFTRMPFWRAAGGA